MSESFVDLSYRGLALGKRIKLTQVRPSTGYLEMPTPMPVGTAIGIATDDGVLIEAQVAEIHEQVGGSDRPPGMLVRPKLDADAQTWWSARVALPEIAPKAKPEDAPTKVTVVSRRMTGDMAVPELVDDGHNTSVMNAIDDTQIAEVPVVIASRATNPGMAVVTESPNQIIDDGKRTVAMDAVDLAALGLDISAGSSGQMPVITEVVDDESSGVVETNGDKPDGGKKKKKKKR